MWWKNVFGVIRETGLGWCRGQTFLYGAALAFYGAFALAPMLMVAIAVAGLLFGQDAAQGKLIESLEGVFGPAVSVAIVESLAYVYSSQSGKTITIIGIGLVIFAVTNLFIQLQAAINVVWGIQSKHSAIRGMLRGRFFAFLLMVGVGLLLATLLIANATLATMHTFFPDAAWTKNKYIWESLEWLVTLTLYTFFFAMIYKLLPDAIITWRDTWIGALFTAVLFLIGNYFIGLYLKSIAPTFAYWAASSLVLIMLWVYYASQVILFGAEFTKNFSRRFGQPIRPSNYAVSISYNGEIIREPAK